MHSIISAFLLSLFVTNTWAQINSHRHPNSLVNALRVGIDTNGNVLYLCRAKLFNSVQPGKTWFGYGRCNVAYGGKEYIMDNYSTPNQKKLGNVYWDNGTQQPIVIGRDSNGRALYLCQSNFKGSIQPGKTWAGYNHCNISYAGQEVITDYYQILTNKPMIMVQAGPRGNVHRHR